MSDVTSGTSPKLSASARRVLAYIERELARGYSGKIEMDCSEGGVRQFWLTRGMRPNEIPTDLLDES